MQAQMQAQMQQPSPQPLRSIPQFGRRSLQPPPQQQQEPYQQKQPQHWSLGGIPGAGMGQPWGIANAPTPGAGGRRDARDVYAEQQRARLLRRPF